MVAPGEPEPEIWDLLAGSAVESSSQAVGPKALPLVVKGYGVLGRSNLGLKVDPPSEDTILVDPAGLPFIQSGPSGAGGAAQANYQWLGIDGAKSFPEEVKKAITEECHAKYHAYGKKQCIHVVGPDLREPGYSLDMAVDKLAMAYGNVFEEFVRVGMQQGLSRMRLLPISGGIFSGDFVDNLPDMTVRAVHAAYEQLSDDKKQYIMNSSIEMCIFMESEFDMFASAFQQTRRIEEVSGRSESSTAPLEVEDPKKCYGRHAPTVAAPPPFKSKASASRVIPDAIVNDADLNAAIAAVLPRTHDFEVHRCIWKLRKASARQVGLQMPEGLQGWATALADIFCTFVPSVESATIFGEANFGACCIDDLGASALGVDFLIHYGHSCLVPTDQTTVTTLYCHVEVEVDVEHLVDTVRHNFTPDKRLAFMSSVQFSSGMLQAVEELRKEADEKGRAAVPQVKPLGVGETLGCTSPKVGDVDAVIFVCDGRFHLESAMIQNPHVQGNFFRYDPACLTLTREGFAHHELHVQRKAAIAAAKDARLVGLVLGTLGRQGSVGVLEEIERLLQQRGVAHFTILLSEISPERLALMTSVDAWVQVACPRLSMDWGSSSYSKPMLTSYEAHVAFGDVTYKDVYPMDYYSNKGGPWANYGTHSGHGGSMGQKFRHLSRNRRHQNVEYD